MAFAHACARKMKPAIAGGIHYVTTVRYASLTLTAEQLQNRSTEKPVLKDHLQAWGFARPRR